jgi:glycosyltransferase involved in cell wall biosynthesis
MLWPFARLRRKPIVWDAFLSLYDTVVEDRQLVGKHNPVALILYGVEWLACRAADRIVLDTDAHGAYFSEKFSVDRRRIARVFVGAETDIFRPAADPRKPPADSPRPAEILFYGQFIPLHGIEYIVRAAKLCEDRPIRWILIGKGQEEYRIRKLIEELRPAHLEWITWVPYPELVAWITRADVCLGIFGNTAKAHRVIPNKVFQILATGKPLVTMDSPAARELLEDWPGVRMIPPGDPQALADAVTAMVQGLSGEQGASPCHRQKSLIRSITPEGVATPLTVLLTNISTGTR